MSTITIKKATKASSKKSRIYIINRDSSLAGFDFTKDEINYVEEQLKLEKKTISVNRAGGSSFFVVPDRKKTQALSIEACRTAGHPLATALNSQKITSVQIIDLTDRAAETLALAEGIALSNYQFLKYRTKAAKEQNTLNTIEIVSKGVSAKDAEQLQITCEAVYIARDLVNEPLSYLTATQFGKEVMNLGKQAGFKVDVLNKTRIESLKMGGLLAVNKGSIDPPVFVTMEYKPKGAVNKQPYVFVGKGVVYDTGGLSLKPTDGMSTMKCDMAGAAAVAAVLYAIAKAGLPVWVVGLTPATDNRPDGNAIVPGDVITISDGTTIEVLNTDAEGRLILSDALVYARKYNPAFVVDLATLTGAASRAIGRYGTVAMGNTVDEFEKLKRSGDQVYERLVEFPLWDEYADLLKSDVADMKNIGGVVAGANTAGKFLEHFTDYPWVHLDIAGPAFNESPDSYRGKGGTGVGVRLLFDFIKSKVEA